jgi:glycosyltransferase involved in cell wall biosynthesis
MDTALGTVARAGRLRDLLRERRPNVVQSWMYFANALSSLMAGRTPVVWGIHNSSFEQVSLASRLCAIAGGVGGRRMASFVVNCSQRSSELHARLGYAAIPNVVIPNGYDASEFRPDPEARAVARKALRLGDDIFVLGTIARWHPHKDIPNLLRALKLAAEQGVPLRCLLIGGGLGPDNPHLAAAIRRSGCEELVVALGTRSDVQELARALDLHVLASSSEAFPNVVAETMLSGTPNLVTDVGDSGAMVGGTGWVVPPRDARTMAAAIVEAYRERSDRPTTWEKRRIDSRAAIARRFTFERMAEAYVDVWRRVSAPQ